MSRFIPAQLQRWTDGLLIQTPENQMQSDRFYRGISTDTRSLRRGEVFLALIGENFDGHNFADKAIEKGAGLLVLNEKSEQAMDLYHRLKNGENLPDLLLVNDTLRAYQRIAEGYRMTLLATVIGVTGSVGKTTTRRMIGAIVETQMKVHETDENENNQIGLPLTLLEADDSDEVVLAEMGMDRRGEIAILSGVAHPDIAIITGIGYSHAEYLGSRENILREKTDIVQGMKSNGLVLISGQDRHLNGWAKTAANEIPVWRIFNETPVETQEELDKLPAFWAEDLRIGPNETAFTAKTSLDPKVAWPVAIPVPGKHLVRAALFGLAAAYSLGLDMEIAVRGCADFVNARNRQRIVQKNGYIVINDSYNSSPESVTAALDTLALIAAERKGRKIVCLGGMKELGSYSRDLHHKIGEKIAKLNIDQLYLVGEEAEWIKEGIESGGKDIPLRIFNSSAEIRDAVLRDIKSEDSILVKGSRSYRMEVIADAIEKGADH